jgi:flagellar hook-basal body complex protein FliE
MNWPPKNPADIALDKATKQLEFEFQILEALIQAYKERKCD